MSSFNILIEQKEKTGYFIRIPTEEDFSLEVPHNSPQKWELLSDRLLLFSLGQIRGMVGMMKAMKAIMPDHPVQAKEADTEVEEEYAAGIHTPPTPSVIGSPWKDSPFKDLEGSPRWADMVDEDEEEVEVNNPSTLAAWSRILNYSTAEVGVFLLANRMRLLRSEWTRTDITQAVSEVQNVLEEYSAADSEDLVKEFSQSYSESDFGEYDSLTTSASSSTCSA